MAFLDIRFPDDIAYGASGGPKFSTDIVVTGSGYEQRNINWYESRGEWNVGHGVKTPQQMRNLLAFFRVAKGKGNTWRFKDWSDFQVEQGWIGSGNGVNKSFQIVKIYSFGSYTHTREIKRPVVGTVKVYVDDVLAELSSWECDYTTGIITFTTAPAVGTVIEVACEFDVVCRFDTDKMDVNIKEFNVQAWDNIPIVEVRT